VVVAAQDREVRREVRGKVLAGDAALPASAGSQRDVWLAVDARAGRAPRVAEPIRI
jgi:hypothetical protein